MPKPNIPYFRKDSEENLFVDTNVVKYYHSVYVKVELSLSEKRLTDHISEVFKCIPNIQYFSATLNEKKLILNIESKYKDVDFDLIDDASRSLDNIPSCTYEFNMNNIPFNNAKEAN